MISLPASYLNELASQIIFISVFLGGFSATLLGTLLVADDDSRMIKVLIVGAAAAAVFFIIATFGMTQLVMITTPGYPFEVAETTLVRSRTLGSVALLGGILTLLFTIAASGWLRSRRLGWLTTALGAMGLISLVLFS